MLQNLIIGSVNVTRMFFFFLRMSVYLAERYLYYSELFKIPILTVATSLLGKVNIVVHRTFYVFMCLVTLFRSNVLQTEKSHLHAN